MPNTPNLGRPYPAGTETPDVAYWMQQLAEDLDTQGTEVTDSDTATETGVLATALVYTAAEITLTPGRWLVHAAASVVNTTIGDTATVELWNATTSAVIASTRGVAGLTNTTGVVQLHTRPKVLVITASTAVRVRCAPNGGSTLQVKSAAGSPAVWLHAARMD